MAENDGTIKIGIEVDDSGIKTGLKMAEKQTKSSGTAMEKHMRKAIEEMSGAGAKFISEGQKEVKKLFDGIASETEKIKTSFARLNGTISQQETGVGRLKIKYQDLILEQGETSEKAKKLGQEIQKLSGGLKENKTRMGEAKTAADKFDQTLDAAGEVSEKAKGGFSVFGDAISSFVKNILTNAITRVGDFVSSIFELSEATEEYRQMMSKISGSAEAFGYSVDEAKDRFKEFYKYVGDDQMAANAITNLMGMKVNTETLDGVIEGAIATWTAYGDSLPLDDLAESITKTVNSSKVVGTLSDAVSQASLTSEEWSGILGKGSKAQQVFNKMLKEGKPAEEAFGAALGATSDKQDRANMV
ncbi:hypothetical protein OCV88_08000, partial [Brotonthovivens ammoniilytica]